MRIHQNHYPERLHCFIMLDMNWIISMTLGVGLALADPITKAKIRYTTADRAEKRAVIEEVVGVAHLWDRLGGDMNYEFNIGM